MVQKNTKALEDKLKEIKGFIQREKQATIQVKSASLKADTHPSSVHWLTLLVYMESAAASESWQPTRRYALNENGCSVCTVRDKNQRLSERV